MGPHYDSLNESVIPAGKNAAGPVKSLILDRSDYRRSLVSTPLSPLPAHPSGAIMK
jgi:hypothetical protein